MSEFSCDILHNILSRLPAKDLFRFKAVCKLWKCIIDDPFFVKSHIKIQQSHAASILIRNNYGGRLFSLSLDCLNYADRFQDSLIRVKQLIHRGLPLLGCAPFLGQLPVFSCNGLILISHENIKKSWVIWNPLVQDYHEVPPPPPATDQYITSLERRGFGYDEASDDYKVVRVDQMYRNKANVKKYYRTLIYNLKSRCWREIKGFPGRNCRGDRGAYFKGALHWRSRHGIIALHLGREDHHLLSVPPPLQDSTSTDDWDRWVRLDALDGCLILSYYLSDNRGKDVWVMKDYETDKTWTKLFSVDPNVRVSLLKKQRAGPFAIQEQYCFEMG